MVRFSLDGARARPFLLTASVLGVLLAPQASALADGRQWWNRAWPWRREVHVDVQASRLPGLDAAWAELWGHGQVKPGGASIRVTTSRARPANFFVMQTGPGDLVRVCFEVSGGKDRYYVYYGNEGAEPEKPTWRPQRGVLLEGWRFRGGSIESLDLTRRAIDKAGEVLGRTFVPNVFLGHDPFGPPSHYCHKYTGWLNCPKRGDYTFCTTSKDASFLLIDGKMVVQWPGRHGPVADARHSGRVSLDPGLHELTYYHVSIGARGRAVAAWQPPGAGRPTVIPPKAFAPIAKGRLGDLDRYGDPTQADMTISGPEESFVNNHYTFRYVFEARLSGGRSSRVQYRWDFGDGATAEGERVEHVYLSPGLRTVSLTAKRGGRPSSLRNRIEVHRDWNRVIERKLEPVKQHADIVATYPFEALAPQDLIAAIHLLDRGGRDAERMKALAALPRRVDQVEPRAVLKTLPELYDLLVIGPHPKRLARLQPETARQAAGLFEQIERQAPSVRAKAAAGELAGRVWLHEVGDLNRAEACFRRVVEHYGDRVRDPAVRLARIGLGEVWLRTGRYRQARQAFEQAGELRSDDKRTVRIGSLAQMVEDYTRRSEFKHAAEKLDDWETAYPTERLRGYSTLLRAKLYFAQGLHDKVVRLVSGFPLVVVEGDKATDPVDVIYPTMDPGKLPELYKIDAATGRVQSSTGTAFPPNPYGMEMGLLAGDSLVALGDKAAGRNLLRVLLQLYPDSTLVDAAKERLERLGT